jgi:hypothetical protein
MQIICGAATVPKAPYFVDLDLHQRGLSVIDGIA